VITKKYKHSFRCDHTDKNGRQYPTCVAQTRKDAREMMDAIVFSDDYVRNQLEIIAMSHRPYNANITGALLTKQKCAQLKPRPVHLLVTLFLHFARFYDDKNV
jgi:hypothetical protein